MYRKGASEDALAAFGKFGSTNPDAKKNTSSLHYNTRNYQKTIDVWEEILASNPEDKEAIVNIERASFHLGDSEKAQECFDKVGLKISPERYSPKKLPLNYEALIKDEKFDLMCK